MPTSALIDTNILIDVLTGNPHTWAASQHLLEEIRPRYFLLINPIIYAEVSAGYPNAEACDRALDVLLLGWEDIPRQAAYLAGQAFVRYRRAGGMKSSPLPDFFIGAHAQTMRYPLITRDAARYRAYFPDVELLTP